MAKVLHLYTDGSMTEKGGIYYGSSAIFAPKENMIRTYSLKESSPMSSIDMEMTSIYRGVLYAREKGYDKVVIYSDCLSVIQDIQKNKGITPSLGTKRVGNKIVITKFIDHKQIRLNREKSSFLLIYSEMLAEVIGAFKSGELQINKVPAHKEESGYNTVVDNASRNANRLQFLPRDKALKNKNVIPGSDRRCIEVKARRSLSNVLSNKTRMSHIPKSFKVKNPENLKLVKLEYDSFQNFINSSRGNKSIIHQFGNVPAFVS